MTASFRVVLDTSVWISGVFYRGNPFRVLQAWRDSRFELVHTPETLDEIESRLRAKAVQFGVSLQYITQWQSYIRTFATLVEPTGAGIGVTRDPEDDKFLDASVSGQASYLVTSDHDLLVLKEFQDVKILSPRGFLELLDKSTA